MFHSGSLCGWPAVTPQEVANTHALFALHLEFQYVQPSVRSGKAQVCFAVALRRAGRNTSPGSQGFRAENFQRFSMEHCKGTGNRGEASDQVMNIGHGLLPVDAAMVGENFGGWFQCTRIHAVLWNGRKAAIA